MVEESTEMELEGMGGGRKNGGGGRGRVAMDTLDGGRKGEMTGGRGGVGRRGGRGREEEMEDTGKPCEEL